MRRQLKALNEERASVLLKMDAVLDTASADSDRALTAEEDTQWASLQAQIDALDKKIELENKMHALKLQQPTVLDICAPTDAQRLSIGEPVMKMPALPRRHRNLVAFTGDNEYGRADERAYRFGQWIMAIAGNHTARLFCQQRGLMMQPVDLLATYNETTNTQGGYLVPPEFDNDIVRLVDTYGVFRRNARVSPMTSDVKSRPRRTGGLTAYFVGESDTGTESTGSWDNLTLTAKDVMVLTRITNQLNADSIIDMADNIAVEAALAFAQLEDNCGFIGTGTSTYGGIVGVNSRLTTLNGVDDGGGIVLGAGNLFSEITLANLNTATARLPVYATIAGQTKWYCSKSVYGQVIERLLAAAGGNTWGILGSGAPGVPGCLGYPVEFTEVMTKTDANSQIIALFGNLRQAADFGDRAAMTIAVSDSASVGGQSVFERNQLAMRVTERFDINVHDIGTATAAGPVVGLISAAS